MTGTLIPTAPAEDQPQGCVLTAWVIPDHAPEWFKALFDHLRKYELAVLWDGTWLDTQTGDSFRRNHLACLIRNEYRTLFPDDGNKAANRRSREFLAECERGAADFLRRGKWSSKTTLEVTHDQIPN